MSKQSTIQPKSSAQSGLSPSSVGVLERPHTVSPHACVNREAAGPMIDPSALFRVRQFVDWPGQPLDGAARSLMEPRFGRDFSDVRVHTGHRDAESANASSPCDTLGFPAHRLAPLSLSSRVSCPESFAAKCSRLEHQESDKPECEAYRSRQKSLGSCSIGPTARLEKTAPPIVDAVLRSPGRPLDAEIRTFMESCFKHDFSRARTQNVAPVSGSATWRIASAVDPSEQEADRMAAATMHSPAPQHPGSRVDFGHVRIHADSGAAESARGVDAIAFTAGHHVVFGRGAYRPESVAGRALLAHELSHVLQQQQAGLHGLLQRKGGTIGGFFSNIGRAISEFFSGKEPAYDKATLLQYLATLDETGDIEDDFDSDNKARAVVNKWKAGSSDYVLTAQRKALLIREMQSGFTGDDDERAILEILERCYNFELSYIFGAGGVSVRGLNSDFHGTEWDRLQAFYERRFRGGMVELLNNRIEPIGYPIALGETLPDVHDESANELPGVSPGWDVPCVLEILCSQDKAIVDQLPNLTVQKASQIVEVYWEYDGAGWIQKTRTRGAASDSGRKRITLKTEASCATAANYIVHEVRHQNQPDTWTALETERDAYTFEEDWAIRRGLPGRPEFRRRNPDTGQEAVNPARIEEYVRGQYAGIAGTTGDRIIDHNAAGETILRRPDGTTFTRPAQAGDSHQDVGRTGANLSNLPTVPPSAWVCPKVK